MRREVKFESQNQEKGLGLLEGENLLVAEGVVEVGDDQGKALASELDGELDAVGSDPGNVGEVLGRGQEVNAGLMLDQRPLEHHAVQPRGVLAEIGEGEGGPEVEQGGKVASLQIQVQEADILVDPGQRDGEIGRQGTGPATAVGPQHGDQPSRLDGSGDGGGQACDGGLELDFQVGGVDVVLGAGSKGLKDQLGVGGGPHGQDFAGGHSGQDRQQGQAPLSVAGQGQDNQVDLSFSANSPARIVNGDDVGGRTIDPAEAQDVANSSPNGLVVGGDESRHRNP